MTEPRIAKPNGHATGQGQPTIDAPTLTAAQADRGSINAQTAGNAAGPSKPAVFGTGAS